MFVFQFFLSKRSVYLLLWTTRLGFEHAGLEFWLSSISCHAPKTPIFIIGTHCDQVNKLIYYFCSSIAHLRKFCSNSLLKYVYRCLIFIECNFTPFHFRFRYIKQKYPRKSCFRDILKSPASISSVPYPDR